MTEKVKLTSEQATAIEYLRDTKFHDEGIISSHARTPMGWEANYTEPLNGLPLLTLVDALRIGYEVEEEYKVGDWAKFHHHGDTWIAKIKTIKQGTQTGKDMYLPDAEIHKLAVNRYYHYVETPTPKEIKAEQEHRAWVKIGREVGEFRDGDLSIGKDGFEYKTIQGMNAAYKDSDLKGFYPAESFISFGSDPDD